ncbi:MAG: hypothetical protein GEV13_34715 [Rhodospirillales bacterium]|nr:hypothetical protein [Rhodospirillales bacterium]
MPRRGAFWSIAVPAMPPATAPRRPPTTAPPTELVVAPPIAAPPTAPRPPPISVPSLTPVLPLLTGTSRMAITRPVSPR